MADDEQGRSQAMTASNSELNSAQLPPESAAEMTDKELLGVLNGQAGEVPWQALARHFAQGRVLRLDSQADLLAAGLALIRDDTVSVKSLMKDGGLSSVSDDEARTWNETNATLWALVVAPWVLVQERHRE